MVGDAIKLIITVDLESYFNFILILSLVFNEFIKEIVIFINM